MENELLLGRKKVAEIKDLIIQNPSTVTPETPIREVMLKMTEDLRTRHVYVVDKDNYLVGEIRMSRMVKYLFPYTAMLELGADVAKNPSINFAAASAAEVMNNNPFKTYEDSSLSQVAKVFMNEKINELPVVTKDNKLCGEVNFFEIMVHYLAETGGKVCN